MSLRSEGGKDVISYRHRHHLSERYEISMKSLIENQCGAGFWLRIDDSRLDDQLVTILHVRITFRPFAWFLGQVRRDS